MGSEGKRVKTKRRRRKIKWKSTHIKNRTKSQK